MDDAKLRRQVFDAYCRREGEQLKKTTADADHKNTSGQSQTDPKQRLWQLLDEYAVPGQIFDRFYLAHKKRLQPLYMDRKQMERVHREWSSKAKAKGRK